MGSPSCVEEGLGECCSGSWESCSSAQISTSCWLHLVAGCFAPFAGDCSRLSTTMSMEATSPSPPLGKLSPPPACRLPRVEAQVVPVIQDRSWQCHVCTYEQDVVPGSRTCVMCHLTRRRLHCAPQRVGKIKLVVQMRGSGESDCPNCRLAERCKACLLARREKYINDTWIDAKGPPK